MDYSKLARMPLFRSVGEGELEAIFSELKITEVCFRKGEVLAMQDEPCNRLILLLEGTVKGEMSDPAGKVVKVEDIDAPSPLAILFLFGQQNRFPVQATALTDVKAVVIPKQSVLRMLSMNETLLKNYLDISADFAARLSRKLHFMSFRTIRQKLAVYLLELAKVQGTASVELDRPRSALAEYFGVSRPSLEREITNMVRDGLIDADKRSFTILDRARLVQMTAL